MNIKMYFVSVTDLYQYFTGLLIVIKQACSFQKALFFHFMCLLCFL